MRTLKHTLILLFLTVMWLPLSAQYVFKLADVKRSSGVEIDLTEPASTLKQDVSAKLTDQALQVIANEGLDPEMRAGIFFSKPTETDVALYEKVRDRSQVTLVAKQFNNSPVIMPMRAAQLRIEAELGYTLSAGDYAHNDLWLVTMLYFKTDNNEGEAVWEIRHYKRAKAGKGGAEGEDEEGKNKNKGNSTNNGYWKFVGIVTENKRQVEDSREGGPSSIPGNNLRHIVEWRGKGFKSISEVIDHYIEDYPDPKHPDKGGLYRINHDHNLDRAEGDYNIVTPPDEIRCGEEVGLKVNYSLSTGCHYHKTFKSTGPLCVAIILDDGAKITPAIPVEENRRIAEKARANHSFAMEVLDNAGIAASNVYDAMFTTNGQHETFVFTAPNGKMFTGLAPNGEKRYTSYRSMYIAVYFGRFGLIATGKQPVAYYKYKYVEEDTKGNIIEPDDGILTDQQLKEHESVLKDMQDWLDGKNSKYGRHTPAKEAAIISIISTLIALLTTGVGGGPDLWFNRRDPNAPDPETQRLMDLDRETGERWREEQRAINDALNKAGYSYEAIQYKKEKRILQLAEEFNIPTYYPFLKDRVKDVLKEKAQREERIFNGFMKQAAFWDKAVKVAETTDQIATTAINVLGEFDPTGTSRIVKNGYTALHAVAGSLAEQYAKGGGNELDYINAANKGLFQGLIGVIQNEAGGTMGWASKYTTMGGLVVGSEMLKTGVVDFFWEKDKTWDRIIVDMTKSGLQKTAYVGLGNLFMTDSPILTAAGTEIATDYITNPLIGASVDAVDNWVGETSEVFGEVVGHAEYYYSNPHLNWQCIYWDDPRGNGRHLK